MSFGSVKPRLFDPVSVNGEIHRKHAKIAKKRYEPADHPLTIRLMLSLIIGNEAHGPGVPDTSIPADRAAMHGAP